MLGSADLDDLLPTDNLCRLDNDACDPVTRVLRWGINSSGHVFSTKYGFIGDIVWLSTSFRDRLGFTGESDEIVAHPSGMVTTTAAHPLPGALFPSRPLESQIYTAELVNTGKRKLSGGWVNNHLASYNQQAFGYFLDGPADLTDLTLHFVDQFSPYIPQGQRVNVYQDWGDPRRSLPNYSTNLAQSPYDLIYTNELNGMRGRVRASVTSSGPYAVTYPSRLRRRSPLTLLVEEI